MHHALHVKTVDRVQSGSITISQGSFMKKNALIALLCAHMVLPAYAGDMYAGFKLGKTRHSIPGIDNTPMLRGVVAGYTLSPSFAVEAGYIDLGKIGGNKATSLDASVLLFYPGGETFSVYAKLSYAGTKWDISGQTQKNSAFTHGLGCSYNISASTSVRFAWDRYVLGNETAYNADAFYVAGIYAF
jgi:hypothetical protein